MATDRFSQLKKNTVDAQKQLEKSDYVHFFHSENTGIRILILGNSITLHGPKPEIGWHGNWGMAASCEEKDYVHQLMTAINAKNNNCAFCVCQVAEWEKVYKDGSRMLGDYQDAREFGADVIVVRFLENCPYKDFDAAAFKRELDALLCYLNPTGKAKVVLTTAFWHHPGDEAMAQYAAEKAYPLVNLGDLGEDDSMKAIGLFAHQGVAIHPGDLGMQHIAQRIFAALEKHL